jgi:hypothetical protein
MNPIILRIILALAPSIERLIVALIDRWLAKESKKELQKIDPAQDQDDTVLSIEKTRQIFAKLDRGKKGSKA